MTDSGERAGRAGYEVGLTLAKKRKVAAIVVVVMVSIPIVGKMVADHSEAKRANEKAAAEAASKQRIEQNRAARLSATQESRALARAQMAAEIAKKDYAAALKTGAPYADLNDPEMASLRTEANKRLAEIKAQQAKAQIELDRKADLARRKREGVHLGMTQQQVLESSWGRPSQVNRTVTVRGTREQWVYSDSRGYLYFDNGILTAVQN
jgi:hypothetical protein